MKKLTRDRVVPIALHSGFARILLQMDVAAGSSELGGNRLKLVGGPG